MKVNYAGEEYTVTGKHPLYEKMLSKPENAEEVFTEFMRLKDKADEWRAAYRASETRSGFDPVVYGEAKYIVNALETLVTGISDKPQYKLSALVKYYQRTGGWKQWVEAPSTVLKYWEVVLDKGGDMTSSIINFETHMRAERTAFIKTMEDSQCFFQDADKATDPRHGDFKTVALIDLENSSEWHKTAFNNFLILKRRIELFMAYVYDGKARLNIRDYGDFALFKDNITKLLSNQCYPATVTDLTSFFSWRNWVMNWMWGHNTSHRYFGMKVWAAYEGINAQVETEVRSAGFGYITTRTDLREGDNLMFIQKSALIGNNDGLSGTLHFAERVPFNIVRLTERAVKGQVEALADSYEAGEIPMPTECSSVRSGRPTTRVSDDSTVVRQFLIPEVKVSDDSTLIRQSSIPKRMTAQSSIPKRMTVLNSKKDDSTVLNSQK